MNVLNKNQSKCKNLKKQELIITYLINIQDDTLRNIVI